MSESDDSKEYAFVDRNLSLKELITQHNTILQQILETCFSDEGQKYACTTIVTFSEDENDKLHSQMSTMLSETCLPNVLRDCAEQIFPH